MLGKGRDEGSPKRQRTPYQIKVPKLHNLYLVSASENPATTPTMLIMRRVVGGIKTVVHPLKM